jgi:hypothetical protein
MLTVCTTCLVSWPAGAEALCEDVEHAHQPWEAHRHVSDVRLPDGTVVVAVSFDEAAPYERASTPDFGLYLDARWNPPWPHEHLAWPDFGVPADVGVLRDSLATFLDRARAGEVVEIGCLGAHGRTGTALACLAVMAGEDAERAVEWVRANYCEQAVETPQQVEFVGSFTAA